MALWTERNVKDAYVCYNTDVGELDCLHCDFSTYYFQKLVRHLNENHPRESTEDKLTLEATENSGQIQKPWKEIVKSHKKSSGSNDSYSSGLFIKDPDDRPSKKPKVEKKIKSPKTEEKKSGRRPSNFFWYMGQESATSSKGFYVPDPVFGEKYCSFCDFHTFQKRPMTLHLKNIHQFPPETDMGSFTSKSVDEETNGKEASVEIAEVFENSNGDDDDKSGISLIEEYARQKCLEVDLEVDNEDLIDTVIDEALDECGDLNESLMSKEVLRFQDDTMALMAENEASEIEEESLNDKGKLCIQALDRETVAEGEFRPEISSSPVPEEKKEDLRIWLKKRADFDDPLMRERWEICNKRNLPPPEFFGKRSVLGESKDQKSPII